jgi:hypothetical protein
MRPSGDSAMSVTSGMKLPEAGTEIAYRLGCGGAARVASIQLVKPVIAAAAGMATTSGQMRRDLHVLQLRAGASNASCPHPQWRLESRTACGALKRSPGCTPDIKSASRLERLTAVASDFQREGSMGDRLLVPGTRGRERFGRAFLSTIAAGWTGAAVAFGERVGMRAWIRRTLSWHISWAGC